MGKEIKIIDYDSEEDILFISRDEPIKNSIDVGNYILDVTHKNLISSIEIIDASENLGIEKNKLKEINKIKMCINYKTNNVYILLSLSFKNKEVNVSVPLNLSLGKNQPEKEILECNC